MKTENIHIEKLFPSGDLVLKYEENSTIWKRRYSGYTKASAIKQFKKYITS